MMFDLRVATKREIALWMSVIEDLKTEIQRLHGELRQEQNRADAAINLLLAKTQHAIIERRQGEEDRSNMLGTLADIFDDKGQTDGSA